MVNRDELIVEVRKEIREVFNEIYAGIPFPKIFPENVDYFVEKALYKYVRKVDENV